jgi:hypothetical protein
MGMGKPLIWDFTCKDTFAASYLTETSTSRGAAAEVGELSKRRHYKDLECDYIFVPVAIETSGSWGMEALSFIKTIGKKIFASTDEPKSTSYLIQRISLAVQRGNAVSIIGTIPSSRSLDEVFYLL